MYTTPINRKCDDDIMLFPRPFSESRRSVRGGKGSKGSLLSKQEPRSTVRVHGWSRYRPGA